MFLYNLLTCEFLLCILIPFLLAVGAKRLTEAQWKTKFEEQPTRKFKYKTESFRNPINLSVTIAGLFIPLIAALIAYLLNNSIQVQIGKMASLFASLCLLVLSMSWGVWLSYSLATVSPDDDTITITKEKNWKLPSHFVAQLALLLTGTILIPVFLVFRFDVPAPASTKTDFSFHTFDRFGFARTPEREIVYEVLRREIHIGALEGDVLKKWGQPDRVERSAGERLNRYTYTSPVSIYIISCRDGTVVRFEIEKADHQGELK